MINKNVPLDMVNAMNKNTILEVLGIKTIELGDDYIVGTMPVDKRTRQPMGLLHGGASAVLIESLGSIGSTLIVDITKQNIVGIDINANHIRGVKSGLVTGKASILHCGRKTHVWQVDIKDDENKLVCSGRLTVMITDKN
jgi:1,4-dihydroxy-2-naphthoyl-CoA hydrolase